MHFEAPEFTGERSFACLFLRTDTLILGVETHRLPQTPCDNVKHFVPGLIKSGEIGASRRDFGLSASDSTMRFRMFGRTDLENCAHDSHHFFRFLLFPTSVEGRLSVTLRETPPALKRHPVGSSHPWEALVHLDRGFIPQRSNRDKT